jgi:hypothetical protein
MPVLSSKIVLFSFATTICSLLPVLLFSYSDDEDRLHDRLLSTLDVLISSSITTASSGGAITGLALLCW